MSSPKVPEAGTAAPLDTARKLSSLFAPSTPRRARLDPERWRAAPPEVRPPRLPRGLVERMRPTAERLRKALPALPGDQRLAQRLTFGWSLAEQDRIESMGADAWLDEQLQPEILDDGGLEDALHEALPSLSMSAIEILVTYEELEDPVLELWLATLYRAAYSPRQLYERMVHFWSDHFSINVFDDYQYALQPVDHRDVIRPRALGRFGDLLRASARSPAMLVYLTNATNVAGHPNENYARELMELHTMGVDGGYTQGDVREVARCLTGWTLSTAEDLTWGTFLFHEGTHDRDAKRVLGVDIPAGPGPADGERVLDILEGHPSTARFVTDKMLRRVLGVDAHPKLVDELAGVFTATGGDIAEVLRAGVREIWPVARGRSKLKRPFHLATSLLRSTFAAPEDPFLVLSFLYESGHLPFSWVPPNGYPDGGPYWAGLPLPRWNLPQYLIGGAAEIDLSFIDPSTSPEDIVDVLSFLLIGADLEPGRRARLIEFVAGLPAGDERLYEGLALVASTPEAQYH